MLTRRTVFWPALLSATAALGCASGPVEGDVDGDGILSFDDARKRHNLEDLEATQLPPCGPEMPFSLTINHSRQEFLEDGPTTVAADYSYRDTDPATVQIIWGDSQFIAMNLNTTFPKDGLGLFYVEGSMLFDSERSLIIPIVENSVLIMEEKIWKFYFERQQGRYWGIFCDNRAPG